MRRLVHAIALVAGIAKNLVEALVFRCIRRRLRFTPGGKGPAVLIVSFIEWQGAFQRPQHLAYQLARMGYSVYYFSLLRIHRAFKSPDWLEYHKGKEVEQGLTVITPLALLLDSRVPFFRSINNTILRLFVHRWCRSCDLPYVIVNAPFFNPVVFRMDCQRLLYDVMDELTAGKDSQRLRRAEEELFTRTDVVTSGTMAVAELKKEARSDIRFISCGVEYDHFARAGAPATETPRDIAHIPRPIVGYFGAVNERIDYELVEDVAKSLPEVSFVFIGPISVNTSSLIRNTNVFLLGWRSYDVLPSYLKVFDIATVPYRLSEGVEYVNPVKVLEYLAGGKPVVSTAIADMQRFYADLVFIAMDAEQFAALLRRILSGGEDIQVRIDRGQDRARERSWQAMAEDFAALLQLPRR